MKLLYGTGNQAKMNTMRRFLKGLEIELIGLKDLEYNWPEVDESGNDPLENARIKALAYYQCYQKPVFSCDSGLYIDGVDALRQPGVHVRNVNGKRLSDQEMIDFYANIAVEMGGSCVAQYRNGICLVINENEIYEYMGEDISGERFKLSNVPHKKKQEGYPLDCLSVHMETGEYYNDMAEIDICTSMQAGFQEFFLRCFQKIQPPTERQG